jgi:hypothetical protein
MTVQTAASTAATTSPARLRNAVVPAIGMLAVATTAVAHVPVAVEHMTEVPYLGVAFYAFVILSAALLGSLLVEQQRRVWAALFALNAAAVAVYVVSRLFGLPAAADDKGDWVSLAGVVSVGAELVVVVVAVAMVGRLRPTSG